MDLKQAGADSGSVGFKFNLKLKAQAGQAPAPADGGPRAGAAGPGQVGSRVCVRSLATAAPTARPLGLKLALRLH